MIVSRRKYRALTRQYDDLRMATIAFIAMADHLDRMDPASEHFPDAQSGMADAMGNLFDKLYPTRRNSRT